MKQKLETEYKGFEITKLTSGFEMFSDRFGSIAKFIVSDKKISAGFAFAVAGIKLFEDPGKKLKDLENIAISKIKEFVDQENIRNMEEYTFEFESDNFVEVRNPSWWIKSGDGDPFANVLRDERFSTKPRNAKYKRYLSVLIVPKVKISIPSTQGNDNVIRDIVINEANLLDPKPDIDGVSSTVEKRDGESHFRITESGVVFLRHSLREEGNTVSIRTLLSTTFKVLKISHFIYEHFNLKSPIYIKLRLVDVGGNVLTTGSPRRDLSLEDRAIGTDIEINEGPVILETAEVGGLTTRIVMRAIRGFGNNRISEDTLRDFLSEISGGR